MKEVRAIIQPFMLQDVLAGLAKVDSLPAATVSEVAGHSVVNPDYKPKPKTKLEMMVPDEMVDAVVEVIQRDARTVKPGDGRIFVFDVETTVKIRTGEWLERQTPTHVAHHRHCGSFMSDSSHAIILPKPAYETAT